MDSALGTAKYDAVQLFNTVTLLGYGENPSYGYRNHFMRSPLALFPPIYHFHTAEPSGIVLPVVAPFVATARFTTAEPISSVKVLDAKGDHEVAVRQLSIEKLDLEKVTENSSDGAMHVHGTAEEVNAVFKNRVKAAQARSLYRRSLGRWVDPLTPPRMTLDCNKYCSITPWDKWCCGHTLRTEVMRVEAVLTVSIAEPADIEHQIEVALRDSAVAGAPAALGAAMASGGTAAANAFVSTFTTVLKARLVQLVTTTQILHVAVNFESRWGPL